MDVERLPSGKFETNELVLELTIIAYNILRIDRAGIIKEQESTKDKTCCKTPSENSNKQSDFDCRTYNIACPKSSPCARM